MNRPVQYESRREFTTRFDEELFERLNQAAVARDVSVNLLVNRAVESYLDKLPAVDDLLP